MGKRQRANRCRFFYCPPGMARGAQAPFNQAWCLLSVIFFQPVNIVAINFLNHLFAAMAN
jgi:hypothetical protein